MKYIYTYQVAGVPKSVPTFARGICSEATMDNIIEQLIM